MCEYPDHSSRLKAAYAGQAARRALSELPPGLYKDVIEFAESGLPVTAESIGQWLEGKGVCGAVDSIVRQIQRHHQNAIAALSEFRPFTPRCKMVRQANDSLRTLVAELETGRLLLADLDPKLVQGLRQYFGVTRELEIEDVNTPAVSHGARA